MPYCLVALFLLCSPAMAEMPQADPFYELFLGIENEKYIINKNGKRAYNSLAAYQARGKYYVTLRNKLRSSTSNTDLRRFLFIAYVAYTRNVAATSEAIISDLYPILVKHDNDFMDILREQPHLQEASCYYLNRHFGFEDKNKDKRKEFQQIYAAKLKTILQKRKIETCQALLNGK